MTAADRIAADLARAYTEGPEQAAAVLAAALAEQVEVVHEPPEPPDGTYPAATLVAALSGRLAAFRRVMPDYREVAEVSVEGDEVVVRLAIGGTLPDGATVDIHGVDRLAVEAAAVVRMTSAFDAAQLADLMRALAG